MTKGEDMATVEDEKGYEVAKQYLVKKYAGDYVDFIGTEGQTYLDGYEQGYEDCRHYAHDYYKNYYKPKWHDLRKNPNDLPERRSRMTKEKENLRVAKWKDWNKQQTKLNKALRERNEYLERELKNYITLTDYILENTFQNEFFGDIKKLLEIIKNAEQ